MAAIVLTFRQALTKRVSAAMLIVGTTLFMIWCGVAVSTAPGAAWLALTIVAGTLVSEDLSCVGAGVLVAQGRLSFAFALAACLTGLFVGDVMLFLAGRWLGRAAVGWAPLKWFVSDAAIERSSDWFERRGAGVIFLSRFVPGTRLPTYFAAGALRTSCGRFALYFSIACAVWTPLLVGLASLLGEELLTSALLIGQRAALKTGLVVVAVFVVVKLVLKLTDHRQRRLLVGAWRRARWWEFWPAWAFYPPVVLHIAWLMLRHRNATLFTAANPAIPAGGFVGESKMDILRGLATAGEFVARAELIPAVLDDASRLSLAREFMAEHRLNFPVALKPNQGQRGAGVAIVRDGRELMAYLRDAPGDTIIQEYASGAEFGVFYYRMPGAARGRIFSITEKRFPAVTGDGAQTLEELILNDERAVCLARRYGEQLRGRLADVPRVGEQVQLVELGTHCRGAIFLDGEWVRTPALEAAFDRISGGYEGFYFGRYDVRTPSVEDFRAGRNFKVVELNGVTSEATNIYDPKNGLFAAYRILRAQWRLAFEIGARNVARGTRATSFTTLVTVCWSWALSRSLGRGGSRRRAARGLVSGDEVQ